MKILVIIFVLLVISNSAHAGITLNQKQFENIDILHEELEKHDTNFTGFSGSKDDMQVYGISEQQAIQVINSLDLDTLIAEKAEAEANAEKQKEKDKLLELLDDSDIKTKIKNL